MRSSAEDKTFLKLKEFIKDPYRFSLFLLLAVYLVGFITVFAGNDEDLMKLTPYNLLFSITLLLYNAVRIRAAYILWFTFIAIIGFALEVAGVKTGIVFGSYSYGNILGIKLFDVPLIIGLNWAMLVIASAALVNKYKLHKMIKASLAASIMVIYDIFLEPVAINYGFWEWSGGSIPLQNYLAWWIIAFGMLIGAFYLVKNLKNRLAVWVIGIQLLFFIVLLIT
jgi:uncharacterized membrane protein